MISREPEPLFITLERNAVGYPPWDEEELWGHRIGHNAYELSVVPTFANGLCLGDVVKVAPHQGRRYVVELISAGGHSTVRVVLFEDDAHDSLLELARRHGADPHHTEIPGYFAIDVPPQTDYAALVSALRKQSETDSLWDVEEATVSEHHSPPQM